MTVTELLTRNLRIARAGADLDQNDVRDRMQALGFTSWQRSTVSLVERGKRKLSVEELVGLALVYQVAPARLIQPDEGQLPVSLPGGFTFPGLRLVMNDGSVRWESGKPVAGESIVYQARQAEMGQHLANLVGGAQGSGRRHSLADLPRSEQEDGQ